jgi:uncharacterized protein
VTENQPRRACFRFYAELNDHLPAEQQYRTLEEAFFTPSTVKDMIESFGVPHTEVDLIIANGYSVELFLSGSKWRPDRRLSGV